MASTAGTYSQRNNLDMAKFYKEQNRVWCLQNAVHQAMRGGLIALGLGVGGVILLTRSRGRPLPLLLKRMCLTMTTGFGLISAVELAIYTCTRQLKNENSAEYWTTHHKDSILTN